MKTLKRSAAPLTKPSLADALPASADRLDLLQTFVRIVECGSLSAAAIQLAVTQPTISRRLQLLERMLGVRLLRRSTHAMALTEDGERCFERAKALLEGWGAFESDLKGTAEVADGTLRVFVPHAFGQRLLVEPLTRFLNDNPKVNVEWNLQDRMPDFIAEGIDCALLVGEVRDPGVVAIKLADVTRAITAAPELVARLGMPKTPEALQNWPWLALRTYYRGEVQLTHRQTEETRIVPIRPRVSTTNLYALRNAAVNGLGACVGSAWLFNEDIAAGTLIRLLPDWYAPSLPMYLVYPYARYYPAKLRKFIDVMRQAIPALL
ncbi:MAG: LysR family transcriptional regulator [Burkholderiales bacterium]|nr:LysR family transcriptional regulator [Burkholderiales bacterium]